MNYFLFFILSLIIFCISIFGIIFNKKNVIVLILSIELLLLACNFNFVFFSYFLDDFLGQIFTLFILTVAAAESAIGLAILIAYFKLNNNISISNIYRLKN
jgi:NADH-quinone oxidoreductase subunit K